MKANRLTALVVIFIFACACVCTAEYLPELPRTGIDARELAVVVNTQDAISVRIGEYYRQRRGIPDENVIRVQIQAGQSNLSRELFKKLKADLDSLTPSHIQAYALAWTQPYRVDCMSITSAVALDFDMSYCSKNCGETKPSGYFNSSSLSPTTDHKFRPAMLLAGKNFEEVKELIDRGVASDFSYPTGTGYLLNTSDKNRSVRSILFTETLKALGEAFRLESLDADSIKDKKDVLFYFTGLTKVADLSTLVFLPGAAADHLTSSGGVLNGISQMSSLRWLEAGATGSYGAVVEPCNHLTKFPHPGVLMWRYAEGATLIEAYWKSVACPGEGVFIGEPLAKPFAPLWVNVAKGSGTLKLFSPGWKTIRLQTSASAIGPYHTVSFYPVRPGLNELKIRIPQSGYCRMVF